MCSRSTFLAALLPLLYLVGCLGNFVAEPRPFVAEGTWRGKLEPVALEGLHSRRQITGAYLVIAGGPDLRRQDQLGALGVSTTGWRVILADDRGRVSPWHYLASDVGSAAVTGTWNSDDIYVVSNGEPMLQPAASHRARDLYNVIRATHIELNAPGTQPATTQTAPFQLRAKRKSSDQIDLTWTRIHGAGSYRVELSDDGRQFHEALPVEGVETSASLVGLEEAESGEYHIRVVALDRSGRPIATSNVVVIKA
jgi:hypothetical protein